MNSMSWPTATRCLESGTRLLGDWNLRPLHDKDRQSRHGGLNVMPFAGAVCLAGFKVEPVLAIAELWKINVLEPLPLVEHG